MRSIFAFLLFFYTTSIWAHEHNSCSRYLPLTRQIAIAYDVERKEPSSIGSLFTRLEDRRIVISTPDFVVPKNAYENSSISIDSANSEHYFLNTSLKLEDSVYIKKFSFLDYILKAMRIDSCSINVVSKELSHAFKLTGMIPVGPISPATKSFILNDNKSIAVLIPRNKRDERKEFELFVITKSANGSKREVQLVYLKSSSKKFIDSALEAINTILKAKKKYK